MIKNIKNSLFCNPLRNVSLYYVICNLVKTKEVDHKENRIEILLTFACNDVITEESHCRGDFVKRGNFKIWVPRNNFVNY